ncbi:hypothetical protein BBK36DRAFT_1199032 [Trichoderma citrinoviride]|uniref:BTB domain-containing protein n=1 Tax=Trichoderma citrinoviride TaxID=58853 RepID=A0A2T4BCA4_9HYPO|nr:hypothetical protein BBK36DRAFT_1199032 [Trichoderma citrinoviride]PTB66963.1 hypothetical protein BBK36DRAFT_1199032 [Trichoderma citrinoviride]
MEPFMYKIDGDGDTILILQKANQPIAARDSDTPWDDALPQYLTEEARRNGSELSSSKLALASPKCRQLTPSNLPETRSSIAYKYILLAEGWDEKALELVMNIIHGRTAGVPEQISLDMLAKIAVIVAHYECSEALKPYADKWISKLDEPFPTSYSRNLVLRLFISWVFTDEFDFKELTRIVVRESRGPMHSLGLPLPARIIKAIDKKRRRIIDKLFFSLNELKKGLGKPSPTCSSIYPAHSAPSCCTILPDALVDGLRDVGLESVPNAQFSGYSIVALEEALRRFERPNVASLLWSCQLHGSLCFLPAEVSHVLRGLQLENVQGLELSHFCDVGKGV